MSEEVSTIAVDILAVFGGGVEGELAECEIFKDVVLVCDVRLLNCRG